MTLQSLGALAMEGALGKQISLQKGPQAKQISTMGGVGIKRVGGQS